MDVEANVKAVYEGLKTFKSTNNISIKNVVQPNKIERLKLTFKRRHSSFSRNSIPNIGKSDKNESLKSEVLT